MQRAIVSVSISISVSILSATALAAQTSANAFVELSLTRADDLQFQRGIFEHQISSDRAALDAGGSGAWSSGRLTLAGSAALRDIGRGLFADSIPLLAEVGVEARYRVKESAHLFAWAGGMGDIGEASRALSSYGLALGLLGGLGPVWTRASVGYAYQKIESQWFYPMPLTAEPLPPGDIMPYLEIPGETEADRWFLQLAGEYGRGFMRPFLEVGGDMVQNGGGDVRLFVTLGVRAVLGGNDPMSPSFLARFIPEEIPRIVPPYVLMPCEACDPFQ
jgi:hypothetical protein